MHLKFLSSTAMVIAVLGCGSPEPSINLSEPQVSAMAAAPERIVAQNEIDGRTKATIVGAFHDATTKRIVFTVHYMCCNIGEKGTVKQEGYVLIDGVKFPVRLTDIMVCGSHTAGSNVIEEYYIDNYRVAGERTEIPGLPGMKSVVFGIDNALDGTSIQAETNVQIIPFSK